MATLLLVRHGQTRGVFTDGYVDLTSRGRAQAEGLGAWLATQDVRPDVVFVGPRPRHQQTHAGLAGAASTPWPAPTADDGLDEHHGLAVMAHAVTSGWVADHLGASLDDPAFAEAGGVTSAGMMRVFSAVMRAWAAGDLVVPDVEPWSAFRARVAATMVRLVDAPSSATVVAVTSAGFVGAAVAGLLGGVDDATTLDLTMRVRNTALSEVRASAGQVRLVSFNEVPHLADRGARTLI
ncbi:MAG: histidine phosphatase family protein [Alphaproteobacteria bacterium]|nr:histidine phosphatase family protein [Alphaproteobacteria bacterium]